MAGDKTCDNCRHLVHLHDENRWECEVYGVLNCGNDYQGWEAVND